MTVRMVRCWARAPERLWDIHPYRQSELDWTGPWATWPSFEVGANLQAGHPQSKDGNHFLPQLSFCVNLWFAVFIFAYNLRHHADSFSTKGPSLRLCQAFSVLHISQKFLLLKYLISTAKIFTNIINENVKESILWSVIPPHNAPTKSSFSDNACLLEQHRLVSYMTVYQILCFGAVLGTSFAQKISSQICWYDLSSVNTCCM